MKQMTSHVFTVDNKVDLTKQFAGAIRCYSERWHCTPAAVHVRQDTPVPVDTGLEIIKDDHIPPAHWYFEVNKEVMKRQP